MAPADHMRGGSSTQSGFVSHAAQMRILGLAAIGIVLAIIVPSSLRYFADKRDAAAQENERRNIYNLVAIAMGSLDENAICPLTGKPYGAARRGPTKTIRWPDPDGRLPTHPQFDITENGSFFQQGLSAYRLPVAPIEPVQGITLTNNADAIVLANLKEKVTYVLPKTGGRLVVKPDGQRKTTTIDQIVAALPIVQKERGTVFTVIYIEDGQVRSLELFDTWDSIYPLNEILHDTLFQKDVPLPKTRLDAYPDSADQ
jgi:type II secretory pathway pseudopilin PulG